ncbi:MAG: hypothetical protein JO317_00205, partial [Verrucomicrobiae bacterium]|nr:hypothetical protein [Verrucomicrobiae bacterium]
DFGLTHAVPSQVVLKTGPHIGPQRFEVKSEPRSKLRKVVDENESIPVPRALAAIRRPAAYNDSALKAFTQALGKAPPSPEIQAALIAAATSNEEALVGPALVALKTYADQLPNDLLTQWLNGKNSALSQTAVRFLMRRDDGAILRTYFDRLPMDSQKQVLRALTDGVPITDLPSARLRKDLVVSALKRWPEKDSSETYYLLNFKGEDIDDAFNQDIEKFIAGFKEPNHRQLWNNTWARRVCTEADSIQGGWVDDRLVAWLKAPPEGVSHDLSVDAGKALVKRNKADKLAPAFASMTPHDRSLLMNLIYLDCVAKKSAPDSLAPFALEALKDSEPGVRRFAFLTLNDFASNQPGVSTALRDALAAETVADVKQDMDRKLTASATAAMNAASANASASANPNATVNNSAIASGGTEPVTGTGNVDMQPFDFAFSGPTQSIVAKAMDGLLFNTKRADNLAQLGEGLAKANAANRAWILLELGRIERFRSEPNFSIAYENVVAQGLIDPDAATRAAAVRAKVATLPLFVSSSLDYAELGIADAARQQELNLEVQRAWAERYADMNRRGGSDHTIRKTTQQKLLELASSPDEPTATAALNGLEVAYDADTVPKLIQIFQTGGSRAKKARILAVTGVNNDEALDMVLPIYSAGLGDADLEVRKATFEHLQHWCSSSTRRPKAFLAVKTAAAAETDPALKKQLEDWMKFAAR